VDRQSFHVRSRSVHAGSPANGTAGAKCRRAALVELAGGWLGVVVAVSVAHEGLAVHDVAAIPAEVLLEMQSVVSALLVIAVDPVSSTTAVNHAGCRSAIESDPGVCQNHPKRRITRRDRNGTD